MTEKEEKPRGAAEKLRNALFNEDMVGQNPDKIFMWYKFSLHNINKMRQYKAANP